MHFKFQIIFGFLFLLLSCKSGNNTTNKNKSKVRESNKKEITLTPITDSPSYSNATISLANPSGYNNLPTNSEVLFLYDLQYYELGNQTPDADSKLCANSGKGQHIHNILNNEPYGAYYKNSFVRQLDDGHYVSLSFLSRSYHESIKTKSAYVLHQFTVGDEEHKEMDLTKPFMFYSRPKGTYLGKDANKILLDFYLVNTTLSKYGNKVRATINGKEFMIDQWVPHFIEGLPMGKVTIKLELMDAQGNIKENPFNPVERTVTLAQDEPLD